MVKKNALSLLSFLFSLHPARMILLQTEDDSLSLFFEFLHEKKKYSE